VCVGYVQRSTGRPVTGQVNRYLTRRCTNDFAHPLFFPPEGRDERLNYRDLFRVAIVSYLDPFTFDTRAVRSCRMFFATDDCRLVPLDTYYLGIKQVGNGLVQIQKDCV